MFKTEEPTFEQSMRSLEKRRIYLMRAMATIEEANEEAQKENGETPRSEEKLKEMKEIINKELLFLAQLQKELLREETQEEPRDKIEPSTADRREVCHVAREIYSRGNETQMLL